MMIDDRLIDDKQSREKEKERKCYFDYSYSILLNIRILIKTATVHKQTFYLVLPSLQVILLK